MLWYFVLVLYALAETRADCLFDELQLPSKNGVNATASGPNCSPGQNVTAGGVCTVQLAGYQCQDAECRGYIWSGPWCVGVKACNLGPTAVPPNSHPDFFRNCSDLLDGESCANYTCSSGYVPGGPFVLSCELGRYNASEATCSGEPCTAGPLGPVPRGMGSLAACDTLLNGDVCANFTCQAGYSPARNLTMSCRNGTYPVPQDICIGEPCSGGPTAVPNNSNASGFARCNTLRTGDTCMGYTCDAGFVPSGGLAMNCTGGTYSAANASCVPAPPCDASVDCFGRAVSVARSADGSCDCTCRNGWSGEQCQLCIFPFVSGSGDCDACADGAVGYPDCRGCTVEGDCNGRGTAVVSRNNTHCECTCRSQWESKVTGCDTCPPRYGGTDCDECAAGRVGYPTCTVCDLHHANCSGRAVSVAVKDTRCECVCRAGWSGDACDVCPAKFNGTDCDRCASGHHPFPGCPPCPVCNNGVGVAVDREGCLCICRGHWEGRNCTTCPKRYDSRTCTTCAAGYHGYPECTECLPSVHCNGRAVEVTSNGTHCECNCLGRWSGANCETCPVGYNPTTCDWCAEGYTGYPDCEPCDVVKHCSGKATAVTSQGGECTCTCRPPWQGRRCDECPPHTSLPACDKCAVGSVGYPSCRPCTNATDCSSRAVSTTSNSTHCLCACIGGWRGESCNVCPPEHTGERCDRCGQGRAGYPVCRVCTTATHCSMHAVSVEADRDADRCQCQCRNQWSGDACDVCLPPYAGSDCNACLPWHKAYPNCTRCAVDMNCATAGENCTCLACRAPWRLDSGVCAVCPPEFAGAACDRCRDPRLTLPSCLPTPTPISATPLPTPPPSPPPLPSATPSPRSDPCASVRCTVPNECHVLGVCIRENRTCPSVAKEDGTPCDDKDPATVDDRCLQGVCVGSVPCGGATCTVSMGTACRRAMCVVGPATPKGVCREVHSDDGTPCDDFRSWTTGDMCVSGTCVGHDIPCKGGRWGIAGGDVDCTSALRHNEQCTVLAKDGYRCYGAVSCIAGTAPEYDSHVHCESDETTGCLPLTLPPGTAPLPSDSTSCHSGGRPPCTLHCALGFVGGPLAVGCSGVTESPCTALRCTASPPPVEGAVVDCSGADLHHARCRITVLTGYRCSGEVVCLPSTAPGFSSTLLCEVLPCDPRTAPTVSGAAVDCSESTTEGAACRVAALPGYQCTGNVVCLKHHYSDTASCEADVCKVDHLVSGGECHPCPSGETSEKGSIATGGDTLCNPGGSWVVVAKASGARSTFTRKDYTSGVEGERDWVRPCSSFNTTMLRVVMGTTSLYLSGNGCTIASPSPLWSYSPHGPWWRSQGKTSLLGGYTPLPGSRPPYDRRSQITAWGSSNGSTTKGGCCAPSYSAKDNAWGQPFEVYALVDSVPTGAPTPSPPRRTPVPQVVTGVFRVRYDKPMAGFSRREFITAVTQVARRVRLALVTVLFVCPPAACPDGGCPLLRSDRFSSGCLTGSQVPAARGQRTLDSSYVWVDFDALLTVLPGESQEEMKALLLADLQGDPSLLSQHSLALPTEVPAAVEDTPVFSPPPGGSSSIPLWLILVGAGGGCLLLVLAGLLCYCCCRSRKGLLQSETSSQVADWKCRSYVDTAVLPGATTSTTLQPQGFIAPASHTWPDRDCEPVNPILHAYQAPPDPSMPNDSPNSPGTIRNQ